MSEASLQRERIVTTKKPGPKPKSITKKMLRTLERRLKS